MAAEVLEIVDSTVDDDEILVLSETPVRPRNGTSKIDAIPVEDYHLKSKRVIDLSQDYAYYAYIDDDEVQILYSSPKTPRVYKGNSSNSKPSKGVEFSSSLTTMCEICADEMPTSAMFRILGCTHSFCNNCVAKYVASKLQDNIYTIDCPFTGCKGFLEPHHCHTILPKQVFDRWGDALCEAVILGSEKFYCPFKDCSALLIDDRAGRNEVIIQSECPDCNRLFCVECKVPWHPGITCKEFQKLGKDERSNEDIMLINLAKERKWMRCPRCGFYVERTQGCLFMKCRLMWFSPVLVSLLCASSASPGTMAVNVCLV
ncbi:hypothetical protein F511_30877 [Dorcoceras hygrometricum]|uniref:RBR-type E3 ubiquitin transferase n=1 Tax=Dorcoceras hygrometricum TaxID=472368 RepID=A0A2Z7A6Z0_9LAMI|nr:hypothetical protein F511_30877 [Dorcoceras hygrometricum]